MAATHQPRAAARAAAFGAIKVIRALHERGAPLEVSMPTVAPFHYEKLGAPPSLWAFDAAAADGAVPGGGIHGTGGPGRCRE